MYKSLIPTLSDDYIIPDHKEQLKIAKSVMDDINLHTKSKPNGENWEDYWSTYESTEVPTYFDRKDKIFRYDGQYIIGTATTEIDYFQKLKDYIFKTFIHTNDVVEYGCGSGNNLRQLKALYPDKQLYGYDISESAVKHASEYAITDVFDMTSRSGTIPRSNSLTVFTCGSMEQLGYDFDNFLDHLITSKLKLCIHIEPFIELYDETNDFDKLAILYHRKRGYLGPMLTELRKYTNIILEHRTTFGNKYNEGYMIVVWSPK